VNWWSWVLTAIGVTGLYFAGLRKPWAWLIGLGAQVLWLTYAVMSRQYGFVVSAFAYGWVYARNARLWWKDPSQKDIDGNDQPA
jgi:nicotinamide riboside transporter PnuC